MKPAAFLVLAALAASVSFVGRAHADVAPFPCSTLTDPNDVSPPDPRLQRVTLDGNVVNVLLPPAYATTTRRYPVLYLFHGAFGDQDEFTSQTDLLPFTAALPDAQQAIVVMPGMSYLNAAADWRDGTHLQETFIVHELIPWIDATYRTIANRAGRAVAGFSGGGLDSMVLAARHPDLFVTAGSFSGFVDQLTPRGISTVIAFFEADTALCGENANPFGVWGDPATDEVWWRDHDPTDLAPGLRGVATYIASGNGVPCSGDTPDAVGIYAESTVFEMSQNLDSAMTAAGLPHTTDFYGCGLHTPPYYQRDIHVFWPFMLQAFGASPPAAFDYRTVDPQFTVWGWSFSADPARAPEFLDVRGASASGVTLTGSGQETLTTAPIVPPNQTVLVAGASASSFVVAADGQGRITFTADLGAPHTLQQYTAAEDAVELADPFYFTTRTITFHRVKPRTSVLGAQDGWCLVDPLDPLVGTLPVCGA